MEEIINILAVDDKPENLLSLEALLEELDGIALVKATSGNEALGMLLEQDFALVLLDVQMPDMDGFEVAEIMRSSPDTKHIPIIFVTALSVEKKHIFRGYEAGAVDYLLKPLEPETLKSKVLVFCELYSFKKKAETDKNLLETTLRSIGDGVVAADTDGVITFVNKVAAQICGVEETDVIGKHVSDVLTMHEVDGAPAPIDFLVLQKVFLADQTKIEVMLHSGNGPAKPVDLCMAPIVDSVGSALGSIITFHDISARREAEKEKEELQKKLRQAIKMEAIGTLAGGIAHDFNNILTPILGYAELTMDQLDEDDRLYHNLSELLRAANRAKSLVKQILTFSRQQEKVFAYIQIQPIVKETIKLLRSTLPATIEVKANIDPNCGTIHAEPTQIHQVVMNICTNAYHAMGDAGGTLDVSVRQFIIEPDSDIPVEGLEHGEYLKLTVSDTGKGMSKDIQDRIFEPYYTTKGVGAGTGMGLAMVHGIVEEHHGVIALDSTVDVGTIFDVYFPVAQGKSEAEVVLETEELPTGYGNILILDDEQQIANLLSDVLTGLGYSAFSYTSGPSALSDFKQDPNNFDLIITDQTMPGMTGTDFADQIRKVRADIPIILCSGFSRAVNEENAALLGVTFLAKPVSSGLLAKTVKKLLQESPSSFHMRTN